MRKILSLIRYLFIAAASFNSLGFASDTSIFENEEDPSSPTSLYISSFSGAAYRSDLPILNFLEDLPQYSQLQNLVLKGPLLKPEDLIPSQTKFVRLDQNAKAFFAKLAYLFKERDHLQQQIKEEEKKNIHLLNNHPSQGELCNILNQISLMKDSFIANHLKSVFEALSILSSLEILDSEFPHGSIQYLEEFITRSSTLTDLKLENNNLHEEDIIILSEGLSQSSSLRSLSFTECGMAQDQFTVLTKSICTLSQLQRLELTDNALEPPILKMVLEYTAANTNLTDLSLRGNLLDEENAITLATILRRNHSLLHLDISEQPLTERSIQALSEALAYNEYLKIFDLHGCEITADGASQLAKMMNTNSTLSSFNVASNHLQNDGLCFMGRALEKNTTLRSLTIYENFFNEESGVQPFLTCLLANTTLTDLSFGDLFLLPETQDLVIQLLCTNLSLFISDLDLNFKEGLDFSLNNVTRNRTLRSYLEGKPS